MNLLDKIRYTELHPAKIITDISCGILAVYFLWKDLLWIGLATAYLPSIFIGVLVIKYADLTKSKNSKAAVFLLKFKTSSSDLTAITGQIIILFGAWHHLIRLILLGILLILISYFLGLFFKKSPY